MEQLTKNQAVATSQEAVQNQNEPQLRDENAHNDKDRKSGSAGMPRPISYAVFCLKKKKQPPQAAPRQPCVQPRLLQSMYVVHARPRLDPQTPAVMRLSL